MIRPFTLEDKDYIVQSHYEIYNKEYQYDLTFRDFITESVNSFIKRAEEKENIWIIDIEGEQKGSISIKKVDDKIAQLGLFLVDPSMRGKGEGNKLMEHAIAFCSDAGYETVVLWTNSELKTARRMYASHGFEIKETRVQILSNKEIKEEKWELSLNMLKATLFL